MSMRVARCILAVVLVATALGGCSAIWVERVPAAVPAGERAQCSRSRQAPIVDTVLAAAAAGAVVGAGVVAARPCPTAANRDQDCLAPGVLALGGAMAAAALTLVFSVSSVYGWVHTARCRALASRERER